MVEWVSIQFLVVIGFMRTADQQLATRRQGGDWDTQHPLRNVCYCGWRFPCIPFQDCNYYAAGSYTKMSKNRNFFPLDVSFLCIRAFFASQ